MEHEHSIEAIRERLSAGPRHNYLRDWIYGGIDGSVTTFAVVTGVVGASLSPVRNRDYGIRQSSGRWFFDGRQQLPGHKV
jgi:hypothetical protein